MFIHIIRSVFIKIVLNCSILKKTGKIKSPNMSPKSILNFTNFFTVGTTIIVQKEKLEMQLPYLPKFEVRS